MTNSPQSRIAATDLRAEAGLVVIVFPLPRFA
jgi:hypothetical protein